MKPTDHTRSELVEWITAQQKVAVDFKFIFILMASLIDEIVAINADNFGF